MPDAKALHRSGPILAVLVVLHLLLLGLPRTPLTIAVVHAAPWAAVAVLAVVGRYRIEARSVIALISVVFLSALVVTFTDGYALNVLLSIATYSAAALLTVAAPAGAPLQPLRAWRGATIGLGLYVTVFGTVQLGSRGFPWRLPYRDYSPDVFSGPFAGGGPPLVTMLAAAALFVIVAELATGARRGWAHWTAAAILAFGVTAPGSNATILAAVVAGLSFALVLALRNTAARRDGRKGPGRRRGLGFSFWTPILLVAAILLGTFVAIGDVEQPLRNLSRLAGTHPDLPPSPKLIAARATLLDLPADVPYQPWIGVGLGNYSSWSQLLLSGVYVDRFLAGRAPPLPVRVGPEAWENVLRHISPEAYARFGRFYAESVATQPWFSWQSLYAEVGLVGLILIGIAIVPAARRLRIGPSDDAHLRALKYALGVFALFAVWLGFVDNYFETQWLMAPLLLGIALLPSAHVD